MNHTFTRLATCLSLGMAALAAAPAAQAALINYTFEVSNINGISTSTPIWGALSYDDALGVFDLLSGDELFALQSFSFSYDSIAYSKLDLDYGNVVFNGGFLGLDAAIQGVFQFLPAVPAIAGIPGVSSLASFTYEYPNGDIDIGDVTFTQVSEPSMGALLAIALLGAATARRVRARQ